MAILSSRHQKVKQDAQRYYPTMLWSHGVVFDGKLIYPKRVLKPGGWVQMVECDYMCQSDNGSITDSHALRQWSKAYIDAIENIKDPRAPVRLESLFNAAGFVEVERQMIPLPLSGWSTGKDTVSSTSSRPCAECIAHPSRLLVKS